MSWVALTCPQCGAPLPRVALWRSVKCGSCGSLIAKTESLVEREWFRKALARARQDSSGGLQCGEARYQLLQKLGVGEISEVYLARRVASAPLLATLKLSSSPLAASRFAREAEISRQLQLLDSGGAGPLFSRMLPEVMMEGPAEGGPERRALVLRHPSGFWGSLAALNEAFPSGLDPRHAVWIWRRMLEVLNFVHRHGWSHGDVRPEHALVHPQDHAVRLIGWASARHGGGPGGRAADLARSARVVQVLLCGNSEAWPDGVPPGLARLVTTASTDESFCDAHGAGGLDALLRAEAKTAFGPPKFVHLAV